MWPTLAMDALRDLLNFSNGKFREHLAPLHNTVETFLFHDEAYLSLQQGNISGRGPDGRLRVPAKPLRMPHLQDFQEEQRRAYLEKMEHSGSVPVGGEQLTPLVDGVELDDTEDGGE